MRYLLGFLAVFPLSIAQCGEADRRFTSRNLFLSFAMLLLLASSCAQDPSTQVVVLMDTDYLVPTEVDRIGARVLKVSADGVGEDETWSKVFQLSSEEPPAAGSYSLPASFGVVPAEGDMDRQIVIEVEALAKDSNEPLVKRSIRTGFIPGESRLVRMWLFRACASATCPEDTTCGCADGAACSSPSCVNEFVNPQSLEAIDDPGALPRNAQIPTGPVISDCEPPLVLCGSECVDTTSDPMFCGSCTTPCTNGDVCEDGGCIDPGDCRTNAVDCSGFTFCDPDTGECLRGCDADEQCRSNETCDTDIHECVCVEGFDLCLNRCVDTQTDPSFCGDCDTSCPGSEVCQEGTCVDLGDCRTNDIGCTGFTYCDEVTGECLRGCSQDAQCTIANEVCNTNNECVCDTGFERCPPFVGAACVDTQTNPTYCGDCNTSCAAGSVCEAGVCVNPDDCRTNDIGCSGLTYCDPSTGMCLPGCDRNAQCTGANERCDQPSHTCVCDPGFERCDGECVDTQTDERHCGSCGTTCTLCVAGVCVGDSDD